MVVRGYSVARTNCRHQKIMKLSMKFVFFLKITYCTEPNEPPMLVYSKVRDEGLFYLKIIFYDRDLSNIYGICFFIHRQPCDFSYRFSSTMNGTI